VIALCILYIALKPSLQSLAAELQPWSSRRWIVIWIAEREVACAGLKIVGQTVLTIPLLLITTTAAAIVVGRPAYTGAPLFDRTVVLIIAVGTTLTPTERTIGFARSVQNYAGVVRSGAVDESEIEPIPLSYLAFVDSVGIAAVFKYSLGSANDAFDLGIGAGSTVAWALTVVVFLFGLQPRYGMRRMS
jgi:hypothetical protein